MKMNQKGEDGMMTPPKLFHQLNRVFKFTYDAACTNKNCLAPTGAYFDDDLDGLKASWRDHRVFCNPPFSGKKAWIEKAHREVREGGCPVCVMVLPSNSMDSAPWHDFIYGNYFYYVVNGRISFIDPKTMKPKVGNNSGTVIVYFMRRPVR